MKTDTKKTELQVVKSAPLVPATNSNAWLDVADEDGGRMGKILKFNKGTWLIQTEEIAPGTRYIAGIDQLSREWIRFVDDGQPPQRIRYKVAKNEKPAARKDLGDLDQKKWEKDADGKAKDPLVLQWLLPLSPVESFDLTVFVTSSRGGDGAIRDLCAIYGRSGRNGRLPIIELRCSSYMHRERKSKIFVPELPIVSWTDAAVVEANVPASDEGRPWDDPIDYDSWRNDVAE